MLLWYPVIMCRLGRQVLTDLSGFLSMFWHVVWYTGSERGEVREVYKRMRCTQGTCLMYSSQLGTILNANTLIRCPLSSSCCHVLKCPWETLNTSLSDSVDPDIALTPAVDPRWAWQLPMSHSVFGFTLFFSAWGQREGRACSVQGKYSFQIFQNVEGERCLCCARRQKNIFFHSSWPGVHIQPFHTFMWTIIYLKHEDCGSHFLLFVETTKKTTYIIMFA